MKIQSKYLLAKHDLDDNPDFKYKSWHAEQALKRRRWKTVLSGPRGRKAARDGIDGTLG